MKKRRLNTRLYLMYLLALTPMLIFGFYKNGVSLYRKGLVDVFGLLKPVIALLLSVAGAILGGILREWRCGEKIDKTMWDKLKCDIVEAALVVAIIPLETNPLVVLGVNFIFSNFLSKARFNRVALMCIIIGGINVLCGTNNFNNIYEASTTLNYDGFDLFFGNGLGGIFSTNVFLIVLALIFLSFNTLYKREMVYASLIVFLLLGTVPNMVMGNYTEIFSFIFGYNILFVLVFIAPNLYSSSYTVKGQVVSGVLIGLITYGLWFIAPYMAAILAVLITSFLKGILDRMFVIK